MGRSHGTARPGLSKFTVPGTKRTLQETHSAGKKSDPRRRLRWNGLLCVDRVSTTVVADLHTLAARD